MDSKAVTPIAKLVVTFRGKKYEFVLQPNLRVKDVKDALMKDQPEAQQLAASDLKLLFKGKVLQDNYEVGLMQSLKPAGKQVYKIMGMGRSSNEVNEIQEEHAEAMKQAPRIRDDLTPKGQRDAERRKRLGRQMLHQASTKASHSSSVAGGVGGSSSSGFGTVEALPNLPQEAQARNIMNQLATDPGILACMKQHNWHVGALKEMYPKGKVGESAVCVMGLNRNKGQEILLRIRTDDLNGFRKILSIRKVLFHELAHNVHSEHDGKFFQLNRLIEKECNALDWTGGQGLSSKDDGQYDLERSDYAGGTHRLGGDATNMLDSNAATPATTSRELRARAALSRMTLDEHEMEQNCGCGQEAKFMPSSFQKNNSSEHRSEADTSVDHDMNAS